jgi:hypothetical protein
MVTHAIHKKWLKVTAFVIGSFGPVFFLGTMARTSAPARLTAAISRVEPRSVRTMLERRRV